MRLLLAEDDRYLSAMLSKGLREHAYAVDVVPDGDAAIAATRITAANRGSRNFSSTFLAT